MNFCLHPILAQDGIFLGDLPLCRVLLMNNRHFPWLALVPRREGLRELFDLSDDDYPLVMQEIRFAAQQFAVHCSAHKMNIAALGNMVPQLHIHVIARFENDVAWPNPVWNCGIKAEPYAADALAALMNSIKQCLELA